MKDQPYEDKVKQLLIISITTKAKWNTSSLFTLVNGVTWYKVPNEIISNVKTL